MKSALALADMEALLSDWRQLNATLLDLPVEAVLQLLRAEVEGRRRDWMIRRLYGRFVAIRRERKERALEKGTWPW